MLTLYCAVDLCLVSLYFVLLLHNVKFIQLDNPD